MSDFYDPYAYEDPYAFEDPYAMDPAMDPIAQLLALGGLGAPMQVGGGAGSMQFDDPSNYMWLQGDLSKDGEWEASDSYTQGRQGNNLAKWYDNMLDPGGALVDYLLTGAPTVDMGQFIAPPPQEAPQFFAAPTHADTLANSKSNPQIAAVGRMIKEGRSMTEVNQFIRQMFPDPVDQETLFGEAQMAYEQERENGQQYAQFQGNGANGGGGYGGGGGRGGSQFPEAPGQDVLNRTLLPNPWEEYTADTVPLDEVQSQQIAGLYDSVDNPVAQRAYQEGLGEARRARSGLDRFRESESGDIWTQMFNEDEDERSADQARRGRGGSISPQADITSLSGSRSRPRNDGTPMYGAPRDAVASYIDALNRNAADRRDDDDDDGRVTARLHPQFSGSRYDRRSARERSPRSAGRIQRREFNERMEREAVDNRGRRQRDFEAAERRGQIKARANDPAKRQARVESMANSAREWAAYKARIEGRTPARDAARQRAMLMLQRGYGS